MQRKLNLQFFAESTNGNNAASTDGSQNTDQSVQNNNSAAQQSNNSEHMIPKSRFDEVNQKFKDVQKQLDDLLAAKTAAEKSEAEKRGEFEKLYQEANRSAETFKNRAEALEGVVTQLLEQRLESIPADLRDLIPAEYSVEQKLAWIANAEQKGLFSKRQHQQIGGETNSNQTQGITKEQFLKMGYQERVKLASDNPELYKKLTSL
jgi:ribonucleoside-triphosphate reductase